MAVSSVWVDMILATWELGIESDLVSEAGKLEETRLRVG